MKREEVFQLINEERDYQDSRWNSSTTTSNGVHTPEEWIVYLKDYLTEAKHFLARENIQSAYPKAMSNIRKVAAMAVKAMEDIETPSRTKN